MENNMKKARNLAVFMTIACAMLAVGNADAKLRRANTPLPHKAASKARTMPAKVMYGAFVSVPFHIPKAEGGKDIPIGSKVKCDTATFGEDPAKGFAKACYDDDFNKVADEGGEFTTKPYSTFYGKVNITHFPAVGDPAPGAKKYCALIYSDSLGSLMGGGTGGDEGIKLEIAF